MRRLLACLLLAGSLGACGNELTRPPDTETPDPPAGSREVRLPDAGVEFTAPVNWPALPAEGARAGGVQSKRATVAVWRYERDEPLPRTPDALLDAQRRLLQTVLARDRTFELRRARRPLRDGAPSVEILGRQTIGGEPYRVRSAHIFHDGAEIVVDAFAPPRHFSRVDRTVFRPLLESLELR